MRRNEGVFGGVEKNEFRDACHSAIIPSFKYHSENNEFFGNWTEDWMRNEAQMTGMSSEWFNMVLSL